MPRSASITFRRASSRVVRTAVAYYAEYPDQIDEWVRRNIEEADADEERWRREQTALA